MKKILSLLLIFILLFLCVGCDQSKKTNIENQSSIATRELYKPKVTEYDNTPFPEQKYLIDSGYSYFESNLNKVNCVVQATFLATVKTEYHEYWFHFKINKVEKGSFGEKTLFVRLSPCVYESIVGTSFTPPISYYTTYDINFEVGKDYLLLLQRTASVYTNSDILTFIEDSLVIPIDESGNPIISESVMYNSNLISHIKDEKLKRDILDGKFKESILQKVKENPSFEKVWNFIEETDINSVCSNATYVYSVEIENAQNDYVSSYSKVFNYRVIKSLKGDIIKEKTWARFPKDRIEVGKRYIIALNEDKRLVSRNAIFEIPE